MDKQELDLSKKLVSSYKKRLEKEIIERSKKLKMPQNKFEEIITNNSISVKFAYDKTSSPLKIKSDLEYDFLDSK